MTRPTGPTDPSLKRLILDLKKTKKKSYAILAKHLEKSRRTKNAVNIRKLAKMSKKTNAKAGGDNYAVPGKVLSDGVIDKPLNVYAWSYSKAAKDKIERAGGECFSIQDIVKNNPAVKVVI